jgi:8-oxo-dGTP pyrophosphatase MutT (NUDIX family)
MQLIYAPNEIPTNFSKSIFLAGPTPRSKDVTSWRGDAINYLDKAGYDGVVFLPEPEDGNFSTNYEDQIDWEEKAMNASDIILFWIPRDMERMPALTTNTEFGEYFKLGKCVLGTPNEAVKIKYQRYKAEKQHIPSFIDLFEMINYVVGYLGEGIKRKGGETQVPLHIWKTPQFQEYYANLKFAQNRIDGAKLLWCFNVGKNKDIPFCYAMHMNIFVSQENRNKVNEIILSRKSISSVLLYKKDKNNINDSQIVLIKEFRSTVNNFEGFVYELPGGSSFNPNDKPTDVASNEVFEETGLLIEPDRIKMIPLSRQIAPTFATHKTHLFMCELSDSEIQYFKDSEDQPRGNIKESEMTYSKVFTLAGIMDNGCVGWSDLGMILWGIMKAE